MIVGLGYYFRGLWFRVSGFAVGYILILVLLFQKKSMPFVVQPPKIPMRFYMFEDHLPYHTPVAFTKYSTDAFLYLGHI